MLSGAGPAEVLGGSAAFLLFTLPTWSQVGPDGSASHVASAAGIPPRVAAALHLGAIAGFWQGAGGGPSIGDADLLLEWGWGRGCCRSCRQSVRPPPDLPSFLLPQSHPQLQQPESLGSASSRSTLRGKSTAHHQVLGPWQVLPVSGSGGWQGSALTTQELGKQIFPIRTNARCDG